MKLFSVIAATGLLACSTAIAGEIPAHIQSAVDNPLRTEENRARDEDRKPGKVLAFYDVKPGMSVVDIASGGGYFTEVLSGAVGPDGEVRAQNRASTRMDERKDALKAHYDQFGNITLDITEGGAPLPYADDSIDMVMLSLIIHHLHYSEETGENGPPQSALDFYAEVKRVLKPGGAFAVIEHTAAPGSSRAESASWHRAPEAIIKSDVTNAGFEFDGAADIHVNSDDDNKNVWFETGLRGKTNRMVHRYRNPAK